MTLPNKILQTCGLFWKIAGFFFFVHDFLAVGNTGFEKAVFAWKDLNAEQRSSAASMQDLP